MNKALNIRLPEDLRSALLKASEEDHVPFSNLIRESLREYLVVRRFRKLRGKVLPLAEAEGFLTDDDILKKL